MKLFSAILMAIPLVTSSVFATEQASISVKTAILPLGFAFFAGIFQTILYFTALNKQAENRRSKDSARDKAIIACAQTLLDNEDVDKTMEQLLEIICNYYKGEFSYVYERNPVLKRGKTGDLSYFYQNSNGAQRKMNTPPEPIPENSKWVQAFAEKDYIYLEKNSANLQDFPPCDSFLQEPGNENLLIIPLRINDRMVGVLGVNNLKEHTKNFKLVTDITVFITNSLEMVYSKKGLENSVVMLEQKNLENRAIFQCVETLAYNEDIHQSIYKLLKIICDYFSAERAYILQKDGEQLVLFNEYLASEAVGPSNAHFHNISFPVILRWYQNLHQNETFVMKNVQKEMPESERTTKEFTLFEENEGFVSTPLFRNDEIQGFLWVDNPQHDSRDPSVLKTISAFVENHLLKSEMNKELEKMSFFDSLTGLFNRNYYLSCVNREKPYQNLGVIFADVNGLKKANDNLGHEYGDGLLKWSAAFLRTHAKGLFFRIGGDEFVCIAEGTKEEEFWAEIDFLHQKMDEIGEVHISIGAAWAEQVSDVEAHVKLADQRMYAEKQQYYKTKSLDPRSEAEQLSAFSQSLDKVMVEYRVSK